MTLLEFNRSSGKGSPDLDLWMGYCAFHMGDYERALKEYQSAAARLEKVGDPDSRIDIFLA